MMLTLVCMAASSIIRESDVLPFCPAESPYQEYVHSSFAKAFLADRAVILASKYWESGAVPDSFKWLIDLYSDVKVVDSLTGKPLSFVTVNMKGGAVTKKRLNSGLLHDHFSMNDDIPTKWPQPGEPMAKKDVSEIPEHKKSRSDAISSKNSEVVLDAADALPSLASTISGSSSMDVADLSSTAVPGESSNVASPLDEPLAQPLNDNRMSSVDPGVISNAAVEAIDRSSADIRPPSDLQPHDTVQQAPKDHVTADLSSQGLCVEPSESVDVVDTSSLESSIHLTDQSRVTEPH